MRHGMDRCGLLLEVMILCPEFVEQVFSCVFLKSLEDRLSVVSGCE